MVALHYAILWKWRKKKASKNKVDVILRMEGGARNRRFVSEMFFIPYTQW